MSSGAPSLGLIGLMRGLMLESLPITLDTKKATFRPPLHLVIAYALSLSRCLYTEAVRVWDRGVVP